MEQTNNSGKVIGSLLLGVVIGGVLGILFAPDKGSETRKKISGKTDDFTKGLKEKFNVFLDETKKEVEAEKEKAKEFVENGKAK